ncbi:MAG TPA: MAPEG family protein [Parvularculaceae bacterium]|nr:MAPEG family protein [Parvularculaceae bacterium]
MLAKQFAVFVQMLIAAALCWVAYRYGPAYAPSPVASDIAARLAFAAEWLLIPGLCLVFGIGLTANNRFLNADAIDGARAPKERFIEINLRYNQNTLEQTVLAAIAWMGLALALPAQSLNVIPVLAVLFGAGRSLFIIGYLIAPVGRAVGFALTFYPTVVAFIWLAWRALA